MDTKKVLLSLLIIVVSVISGIGVYFISNPHLHFLEGIFENAFYFILLIGGFLTFILFRFNFARIKKCLIIIFITFNILGTMSFFAYGTLYFKDFEVDTAIPYKIVETIKKEKEEKFSYLQLKDEKKGKVIAEKFVFKQKDELDFKIDKREINQEIYRGNCFTAKSRKNLFFLEIYLEQYLDSESDTCRKYSNKLDIWERNYKE